MHYKQHVSFARHTIGDVLKHMCLPVLLDGWSAAGWTSSWRCTSMPSNVSFEKQDVDDVLKNLCLPMLLACCSAGCLPCCCH